MTDVDRRVISIVEMLESLAQELPITLSDERIWLAMAAAMVLGAVFTWIGVRIARRLGLLAPMALRGEVVGIGLGTGLTVAAAGWAAVGSGGRSAYTPVAVAFALTLGADIFHRGALAGTADERSGSTLRSRSTITAAVACAGFIAAIGLFFGATLAPSPRDGAQPVEFFDTAFYSVLGADLARTGVETIFSPAGFEHIAGLPPQTWYHWGELWLAAAVISLFGTEPVIARHLVVLPLVLLAVAALTGTLVRRAAGTSSRGAFVWGAIAALVLAPVALPVDALHFTRWGTGFLFAVTQYGLAAIPLLLAAYATFGGSAGRTVHGRVFTAALIACIIPSHALLAAQAALGVAVALVAFFGARAAGLIRRESTWVSDVSRLAIPATAISAAAVVWGFATGHGFGASGMAEGVASFADAWGQAVIRTALGAGLLIIGPLGWCLLSVGRVERVLAGLAVATSVLVGALAWGARYADFNMFHAFFGPIVILATPLAAASSWVLWRAARRFSRRLAAVGFVIAGVQLGMGGVTVLARIETFTPRGSQPVPQSVLGEIEQLPSNAKLAYSCLVTEESAIWDPWLVSINAHTGRRIVPMCFQAEYFTHLLTGLGNDLTAMNPLFAPAPQRTLYSSSDATPTSEQIEAFLRHHGIGYIYADRDHPNELVEGARAIVQDRGVQLLQLP